MHMLATYHICCQKRPFSPSHFTGAIRLFPPSDKDLTVCRKGMVVKFTTAFPSVPQVQSAFVQVRPVFICYALGMAARPDSVSLSGNAKGPPIPTTLLVGVECSWDDPS